MKTYNILLIFLLIIGGIGWYFYSKENRFSQKEISSPPTIPEPSSNHSIENGTIVGKFTYICPIGMNKSSCVTTLTSFRARILVRASSASSSFLEITRVPIGQLGQFSFTVPEGSYSVDIISDKDQKNITPLHPVVVKSGEIFYLNLIETSP